jgi:radical SAM family uncharacterized protein
MRVEVSEVAGENLKEVLFRRVLPGVQTPAQYMGGEVNMVRKPHASVRGKLCLSFPDLYTIGMSHHGFQVLYSLMNAREDWVCERVFAPWLDMEEALRRHGLPLYSLESFTPVREFDVLGFSLQYELCYPNLLTILDLAGIPLRASERSLADPLIIAGGPCAQNPEPLAPFIDLFVMGDGEPSLPRVCDLWLELKQAALGTGQGRGAAEERRTMLREMARQLPFCYVPSCYEPEYREGRFAALHRLHDDVPAAIEPALIRDLDGTPLPTRPIVSYIECVHDRIAIEIMRGCPWQCRFCQSTAIKRPLRIRSVDTIVQAALESYRHTGFNEISLLSLSSSDYPHFEELIRRLKEVFGPLHVNISVPSLRVNDQLRTIADLLGNDRRSSLTLAPEVARDDMREQIRKRIKNEDLFEGCRAAFRNNYESVKLYFLCGLPGERPVDLEGIIEMSETIARLGREVRGRYARVTASVSNFVPKSHTPYQWNGMQTREYFRWAHDFLWRAKSLQCVQVKRHDIETSMLEGALSRGDRRMAEVIELAWRNGARMDSWREKFSAPRWWQALADVGLDQARLLHEPYPVDQPLPWDHVLVKTGRAFLEKEQQRSATQLTAMQAVGPGDS